MPSCILNTNTQIWTIGTDIAMNWFQYSETVQKGLKEYRSYSVVKGISLDTVHAPLNSKYYKAYIDSKFEYHLILLFFLAYA